MAVSLTCVSPMTDSDPSDPNADMKRALRRLLATIAAALVFTLALIWYLWEHSPKPP